MPLVISYRRYSKPSQGKGHSTKRQKDGAKEYADRQGWTIDESRSFDDKGMSAFRSKHAKEGAFAGFLAAVKAGIIRPGTILIVEHLDRMSRDKVRVARDQFEALLEAGIEVVTLTPERHYTVADLDDMMALMEPLWLMYRAHEESKTKSKRLRERFADDRAKMVTERKPRGAKCPAWLEYVDGRYRVIPSAKSAILEVYRLATDEGMGAYAIARRLNANGTRAVGKSGKWNVTYVQILLKDRRLLGECQPHKMDGDGDKRLPTGQPIPDYYPRVVSDEVYYRAQGEKATRTVARGGRTGNGVPNLFTGLIYDGAGSTMQTWTKSTANKSRYLTSSAARARREGEHISFPYEYLEEEVLRLVIELTSADLTGEADARKVALEGMDGELTDLTARIERIKARTAVNPTDELMDLVEQMSKARKALAERIEVARGAVAVTTDHLSDCQSLIPHATDEDKRRRIKARLPHIIERITVCLTRTDKRAVMAEVFVRWVRGDLSQLSLHSRKAYKVVAGMASRTLAHLEGGETPDHVRPCVSDHEAGEVGVVLFE